MLGLEGRFVYSVLCGQFKTMSSFLTKKDTSSQQKVFFQAMLNNRRGRGGGSKPGRSQT